ncbi:MAG: O-antigen ligase family protein [Planctomycetaceae bacterium]
MHGGRIPHARLVLQAGTIIAALLSVGGRLLRGKRDDVIPVVILPLVLLAAVGLIQLLPIHRPLISGMDHAVHPELRSAFELPSNSGRNVLTASPSDTRFLVAQLTSLILLAFVAFEQVHSRKTVLVTLGALTLNAAANAVLALLQLFSGNRFLIHPGWWDGAGSPFSTFVNSNGAAGWLCLGLAAATGLLVYPLSASEPDVRLPGRSSPLRAARDFAESLVGYFARFSVYNVLAWTAFGFIGTALAATKSRAGISAAIAGLIVVFLGRISLRRLPATVLSTLAGIAAICGLLVLFKLDAGILKEMRTLRDPLTEAGSRFAHWGDSAGLIRDFPLTGGGLGAYKFATLPYQRHVTHSWFKNADNQFVEVLLEGGIVGFGAFLLIGIIGLVHGSVLYRTGLGEAFPSTHRSHVAVGAALLFGVVSQLFAGMFDFGLGLPPASVYLVLLTAVGGYAVFQGLSRDSRFESSRRHFLFGIRIGWLNLLAIKLSLLVASVSFLPDLWAATRLYPVTIAARQSLAAPVTPEVLQQRSDLRKRLIDLAPVRADDADAFWVRADLAEDALRQRVLLSAVDVSSLAEKDLQQAWSHTSVASLSHRYGKLQTLDNKSDAQALRRSIASLVEDSQFLSDLRGIQSRFQLMPKIAERLAVWELFLGQTEPAAADILRADFLEPNQSQMILRFGYTAFHTGSRELGTALYHQAIAGSEPLRATVLLDAVNEMSVSEALKEFGPDNYEDTVAAASRIRHTELREALLLQADDTWRAPEETPRRSLMDSRISHLLQTRQPDELEKWLEQCLTWVPNDTSFLATLADHLRRQGRLKESLEKSRRIEFADPNNTANNRRIKDLQRKLAAEK